ncbi:uncharacterized protein J4E87_004644 [Alternaria ethzedia]|uniref:uncharacterized protein n=1 Tax=Alternaria ethzedia TaxID=181014 RepID=UPI0020C363B3|nr:uncharacterized protein J4E87_004644 [Alternaria ethzedia]XP_051322111.1 uncharacterized protein J4E85_009816 [Alternaria conjuncta]KAI4626144.1 hypothetical protein J4E87_004644 [Alternaria ethzedia]KAI4917724.1 hypothetical protein J4E85_009816 [Alternaria conjuncta]
MPGTTMTKTSAYPYILTTVATRKEGISRAQFHQHNEEKYAPLLKKIAGKVHPLSWTRHYHVDDEECPIGIPRVLIGVDDGMDWDCMGTMAFEDELHLQQFIAFMHSDAAIPVLEEEEKFAEPTKTKLLVMKKGVSVREG